MFRCARFGLGDLAVQRLKPHKELLFKLVHEGRTLNRGISQSYTNAPPTANELGQVGAECIRIGLRMERREPRRG